MSNKIIHITRITLATLCIAVLSSCDDDETKAQETTTPSLNASPTSLAFSKMGGSLSLCVNSTTEPTILTSDSWFKVSLISGADTTYLYNVTADAYTTGTANRSSSLTILSGELSIEIPITQSCTLAQTIEVDANGGSFTINIDNTSNASITTDALWLTSLADGSYTAAANTNNSTRTGFIIYTLDSSADTISIVQAAGAEPSLSISSTAMDIAPYMYPAWNLGNTMEAIGNGLNSETYWQSTKTTQSLIDFVKALGFKSVRIPCSWYIHCPNRASGDYTIDADWMARVKEIVDYCINDDLYVELNDHWDNGWIEVLGFSKSSSSYTAVDDEWVENKIGILKDIWTQIATEFIDYDHHLLLAGLNEPFQEYSLFNGLAQPLTPILERYNQAFVDAVRATGGNNVERVLVFQGSGANASYACSYLSEPNDIVNGKLMMEVHYYDPYNFTINTGSGYTTSWNSESSVKSTFANLKEKFVDAGIPILLGEYAANWRGGLAASVQTKHNASIKAFYKAINKWGPYYGVLPFAWDTNYVPTTQNATDKSTSCIVNRSVLTIYNQYAYSGIIEGSNASIWVK